MKTLISAALIGLAAALPLIFGAWIALKRPPSSRVLGLISAFGAGALISAVSFDLVLEASGKESPALLATALALGTLAYFLGSKLIERGNSAGGESNRGLALLMGATLDAIPESLILGISIAAGSGLSLPFLLAVVLSNLPEGMASAAVLGKDPNYPTRRILSMWCIVVCISGASAVLGAVVGSLATITGAGAQAFAAGALLTMITNDLIPEARENAGLSAGLAVVLGFAVAFALHQAGA